MRENSELLTARTSGTYSLTMSFKVIIALKPCLKYGYESWELRIQDTLGSCKNESFAILTKNDESW